MFEHVAAYAGDPILSLNEDFQRDRRPGKVNLSIGIYFDDSGALPIMGAVRVAERRLSVDLAPCAYLPMSGSSPYKTAVQTMVFGANRRAVREGRIATMQTLGASGALKVGGDFLKRHFPHAEVWISDPSWENHRAVFEGCGFNVRSYPYYDPSTGGLRFDEMLATIGRLAPRTVVLLHASCHNPTGVDLSRAQWDALIPILRERELIAFVDMAYQGLGDGVEEDAYAPRAMADAGVTTLVANSFSKNFSLYGDRCGGLSVVCNSSAEAMRVAGQLTAVIRANYSSPPAHGAKIIAQVLDAPELHEQWQAELNSMRHRILSMRQSLHAALAGRIEPRHLDRYLSQRGMFTYTGLSEVQVDRLREDHGIYLLRSGRMCIAGLNTSNIRAVADAISAVSAEKVG